VTSYRASSRIGCLVVFACVLACAGCSKPPMFHIVVETMPTDTNRQYKIFANGQEMGTIVGDKKLEFDIQGQKADEVRRMLPGLNAKMLFVCGWETAPISISEPGVYEMEAARKEHRATTAHVMIEDYLPPAAPNVISNDVAVFVDNRGGPEQTVAIGELKKQVAAGAVDRVSLPYSPTCDEAKQLRVNGQVVSALKEDSKNAGHALPVLIDTSSSHCYRSKWQNYSQYGDSFGPASGQGKIIYRPRPAQVLEETPNFFLQPLPEAVEDFGGYASRTALAEVACR